MALKIASSEYSEILGPILRKSALSKEGLLMAFNPQDFKGIVHLNIESLWSFTHLKIRLFFSVENNENLIDKITIIGSYF